MTILVTGATGSVGRLVVDELVRAGASVRALTVNPTKAALPDGVEVFRGNINKPTTLQRDPARQPAGVGAFDGVDRMYLAPAPEVANEVVRLARDAGVRHIVDLSGEPASWWHEVAAAVERSGVAWTHLWAGEFMENSTIWSDQIRTNGQVRDAYPDAGNAPIAMADIAAVAATALLDDGHAGQAYSLTGPETLRRDEMVQHIGAALGQHIPFIEISRDEAVEQLAPQMGDYAAWYVDGAGELVDSPQAATQTLSELLPRPATTFARWAVQNVDAFR